MSDLDLKPSAPSPSSCQGCESLQKQLNILLLALIILSATVAVFLWRQVRYLKADMTAARPAFNAMSQGYAQEKPAVDAFVAKVTEYARTHPDFAPIAQKYQLLNSSNSPKPAAAAPAPGAAPGAKK